MIFANKCCLHQKQQKCTHNRFMRLKKVSKRMFFFIIIYQYHLPISSINIQEKEFLQDKEKKLSTNRDIFNY